MEKRFVPLRAALDSLDITIGLFDPTLAPKPLRPRLRRVVSKGQFKMGELTRVGLACCGTLRSP